MKEFLIGCLGWIGFSLVVSVASLPWLYLFFSLGIKQEAAFFGAIGLGIASIIGGSFGFRALGKWRERRRIRREQLEKEKNQIIAMIDEALEEKR